MTWEATVAHAAAPRVLARALAATTVVVVGAAGAHTWAGGDLPTGPGLAVIAAVVLGATVLVLRRAVPGWALLPVVALAQLGVHESFGLVAGHEHLAPADATPMSGMWGMSGADGGSPWQMLAAHLFVTALTALLWWAGRRAASCVVALRPRPGPPALGRRPAPRPATRRPALVHLLVSPRRGPPAGSRTA